MNRHPSFSAIRGRRAFTLIELLVVLGIIAILITLSITVGRQVSRGGEDRITRDMERVLDMTLSSWFGDKDSKFPSYLEVADSANGPEDKKAAIIDATRAGRGVVAEPTLAMFLLVAKETASVDAALKQQIDAKYLKEVPLRTTYDKEFWSGGRNTATTITDAWGRPFRFVHPVWHGGYGGFVRGLSVVNRPDRDVPDIDGTPIPYTRSYRIAANVALSDEILGTADEGLCPGNRPYFYSAGRDGDPGTREDNVYATPVAYPSETATLK